MIIKKGTTDVTTYFNLVDSTAGTPETGLTITNIDATYTRNRAAATKNDLTAHSAVTDAHADNKGIEVDGTNAPGLYRVDFPDAAFATGADKVILTVTCSGCAPAHLIVQLVNYDPEDAVRLGLTALPNAAADAAGGLPISDAGGLDLDAQLVTKINDILTDTGTTLQAEVDGIQADTEDIQSRLPAALVGGRIDANVGAISTDATAADNLEAILDGTGGVTLVASAFTLTTPITANATQISGDATAADNLEAAYDGNGYAHTGNTYPWTAAWDAEVQSEVDDALIAKGLDHLVFTSVTGTDIADDSIIAKMVSKSATADWDSYVNTTDSHEALRDRGDAAWITATGFSTLDAAGVRTAVGLASANLDTQLSTIDTVVDSILDDTGTAGVVVASLAANSITAAATAADFTAEIFGTALTESYGTDGSAMTAAQLMYMILAHVGEFSITSTTKTLKKLDGTTTAATCTLDSSTAPTSITRAT